MTNVPKALVPLPDHKFYLWQMLVHWAWMREREYPAQYLLYCGATGPSRELVELMRGMGAKIAVWNDWRINPQYNPSMKPGLAGQWLKAHPEDREIPLLLCDPDALPLPRFATAGLEPAPGRWFGSDTDSYTGPNYLKSKGEDLWVQLCELVGVDPAKAAATRGRGSQWLFVGPPEGLWEEIAELSEKAYSMLVGHSSDVQAWCAEMYVTQLVLARENIETEARATMRMTWAGDPKSQLTKAGFYHNAGVTDPKTGHFYKGGWTAKAPFFAPLDDVRSDSASTKYVEAIREAEKAFPELCAMLAPA